MKKGMNRTKLGKLFDDNSVNQAEVSRKTGIGQNRIGQYATKDDKLKNLKANELYLIALAIGMKPSELLEVVCAEIKLKF